jgi:ABC-2 type transport system ATP-binding protein
MDLRGGVIARQKQIRFACGWRDLAYTAVDHSSRSLEVGRRNSDCRIASGQHARRSFYGEPNSITGTIKERMLELQNVTKLYSAIPAVSHVSFSAPAGEVTGYLGPNGSGKSTTLKMIASLIEPTEGEILFRGEPISRNRMRYRQSFGYVPEEPQLYPHLTGEEYIRMVGELRGLPEEQLALKIDGFLRLFSLNDDRHVAISSYSKGMRQKVLLASALLHNPDLILLDEPFSGLDVNSAMILKNLICELATRGKVVLFSSHELETVERVCSRVVILHKGNVVANDSIENLRGLMSLPTLEEIFSQLALEQDPASTTREILELMEM